MATSYYSTGTITLTNDSTLVLGNGTAWATALIAGGNILVEATNGVLPIETVDGNTQITTELKWTGESGTYNYVIQRDTAYLKTLDKNSENVAFLLDEIRKGTIFKYDISGSLADRSMYDARSKGFSYLVTEGGAAQLYVKNSNAAADWIGPFAYGAGPPGPMGPAGFVLARGTYNPAAVYARNDGVLYNGSSWVALQTTQGTAPPNLPITSNAFWQLIASKGADGNGAGDMLASIYDPQNRGADIFAGLDAMVRFDADAGLSSQQKGQARANIGADKLYNWVINGEFNFNIRGGTRNPNFGSYGFDRWKGHPQGLEQPIEALPADEYTLTWSGGGTGSFGGVTGPSPIKATVSAGTQSVIVPSNATRVSLVSGDATAADPFYPRPFPVERMLCRQYARLFGAGAVGVAQTAGGVTLVTQDLQGMRGTPAVNFVGPAVNILIRIGGGYESIVSYNGTVMLSPYAAYVSFGGSFGVGSIYFMAGDCLLAEAEI